MDVEEPSVASRVRTVARRLGHTVEEYPLEFAGAAVVAGAWLGLRTRGRAVVKARLVDAIGAALGAVIVRLATQLAREVAMRELGEVAKRWWDETAPPGRRPAAADTDVH